MREIEDNLENLLVDDMILAAYVIEIESESESVSVSVSVIMMRMHMRS